MQTRLKILNLQGSNAKRCEHAKSCTDLIQTKVAQVGVCRVWMHVREPKAGYYQKNSSPKEFVVNFGCDGCIQTKVHGIDLLQWIVCQALNGPFGGLLGHRL